MINKCEVYIIRLDRFLFTFCSPLTYKKMNPFNAAIKDRAAMSLVETFPGDWRMRNCQEKSYFICKKLSTAYQPLRKDTASTLFIIPYTTIDNRSRQLVDNLVIFKGYGRFSRYLDGLIKKVLIVFNIQTKYRLLPKHSWRKK